MSFIDIAIWLRLAARWRLPGSFMPQGYLNSDRSDADLMLKLTEYNEGGRAVWLRIGRKNYGVPAVHVLVSKNPLWPSDIT
jgi:hypothetical protein